VGGSLGCGEGFVVLPRFSKAHAQVVRGLGQVILKSAGVFLGETLVKGGGFLGDGQGFFGPPGVGEPSSQFVERASQLRLESSWISGGQLPPGARCLSRRR